MRSAQRGTHTAPVARPHQVVSYTTHALCSFPGSKDDDNAEHAMDVGREHAALSGKERWSRARRLLQSAPPLLGNFSHDLPLVCTAFGIHIHPVLVQHIAAYQLPPKPVAANDALSEAPPPALSTGPGNTDRCDLSWACSGRRHPSLSQRQEGHQRKQGQGPQSSQAIPALRAGRDHSAVSFSPCRGGVPEGRARHPRPYTAAIWMPAPSLPCARAWP